MSDIERIIHHRPKIEKTSPNASKYRGVTWYAPRKTWRARIGFSGKKTVLGYFKTEEEAALAYNIAAKAAHGDFAILNEIENRGGEK